MTVHNEAKKGEIAKTVLMPGDPMRAKLIAEKYLTDYKLVNSVRGMYAYTGLYKGKSITVMASGMGIPRIGSCGSYLKDLDLYDIVIAESVYSKSTYAEDYKYNSKIVECSKYLLDKFNNKDIKIIRAHTSDTFYVDADIEDIVNNKKCSVVEMETFGLYFNAKMLNKNAIAIYTVSDNLITKEETTSEERQNDRICT